MPESSAAFLTTNRYAVVTGGNRGIGLEICRQLASHGVTVILTARDPGKGLEAVENLKKSASDLSDRLLLFHQLDVNDDASVSAIADFIKSKFGKLDILVNNAGVSGIHLIQDVDALRAAGYGTPKVLDNYGEITSQTQELVEECININYYGVKKTTKALLPLIQLSDSGRIVNISSAAGKLRLIHNEWARGILGSNGESIVEERVDEAVNEFLKDFKEGTFAAKGWPAHVSAYTVSKAAVNTYTRLLAWKYPTISVNCISPGPVATDMTMHLGCFTVKEGAQGAVRLALMPAGGPSGLFYHQMEVSSPE